MERYVMEARREGLTRKGGRCMDGGAQRQRLPFLELAVTLTSGLLKVPSQGVSGGSARRSRVDLPLFQRGTEGVSARCTDRSGYMSRAHRPLDAAPSEPPF